MYIHIIDLSFNCELAILEFSGVQLLDFIDT